MLEYMVSTEDNPFNPFTQSEEWEAWDTSNGYNTWCYIARLAPSSPYLDDKEEEDLVKFAIDEILLHNITGNYIRVKNPEYKK